MPNARPRVVPQYGAGLKLTPVRLSQQPVLQVKTVAAAPALHPLMFRGGGRIIATGDCEERGQGQPSQTFWTATGLNSAA